MDSSARGGRRDCLGVGGLGYGIAPGQKQQAPGTGGGTRLGLLIVIIRWKFEWLGAVAAGALALLYAQNLPWTNSLIITGPLVVVAALYAANALGIVIGW